MYQLATTHNDRLAFRLFLLFGGHSLLQKFEDILQIGPWYLRLVSYLSPFLWGWRLISAEHFAYSATVSLLI